MQNSYSFRISFTVFILLAFLAFSSVAQSPQLNEEMIHSALKGRNIDEEELAKRLEEKSIDIEALQDKSPEELLQLRAVVEETISEMEEEKTSGSTEKYEPGNSSKKSTAVMHPDAVEKIVKTPPPLPQPSKNTNETPVYGKSIFQGSISLFERTDDANVPPAYVLGPGDKLSVSIWGISQFNRNYEIGPEGYIQPDRMPRIYLKGLTLEQGRKVLRDKFRAYYPFKRNEFEVALTHIRSITVHIYGEVMQPGGYNIPATNTALNALVAAGGPSKLGSIRKITLVRGKKKFSIDVYKWLSDPSYANQLYLRENDVIHVPIADHIVEIKGAVYRPMKYEMIMGEQLSDLLNYAGGMLPSAYRDNINITRYEKGKKIIKSIPWAHLKKNGQDVLLLPGDLVELRTLNTRNKYLVSVEGAVEYSGNYAWTPGTKVKDILMKAKLSKSAKMDLAYVTRMLPDSTYEMIKIHPAKALRQAESSDNISLEAQDKIQILDMTKLTPDAYVTVTGQVYNPGRLPFDKTKRMRVSDAILLSDGLKDDAFEYAFIQRRNPADVNKTLSVKVNVKKIMEHPGSEEDIALESYDKIIIEADSIFRTEQFYTMDGAVKISGRFVFREGLTVEDAILLSGGVLPSADLQKVDVFRVASNSKKGLKTHAITVSMNNKSGPAAASSFLLQPDDHIVVRNRSDYQKQQMVFIEGEVKYPGYYALTHPNERLAELIAAAGGLTDEAFTEGAQLYRSKDSLGFVVIKLDQALKRKNSRYNIVLAQDDRIVIPKLKDLVSIEGATNASEVYFRGNNVKGSKVSVPYVAGKNAKYYIDTYAAGISKNGDKNKITVIHPNGRMEHTKTFLFFRKYPKVRNGSVIYVGYKAAKTRKGKKDEKKFDWEKVADNTLRQVTTILSLVILAKSASSL